jgi:hypothetical protein
MNCTSSPSALHLSLPQKVWISRWGKRPCLFQNFPLALRVTRPLVQWMPVLKWPRRSADLAPMWRRSGALHLLPPRWTIMDKDMFTFHLSNIPHTTCSSHYDISPKQTRHLHCCLHLVLPEVPVLQQQAKGSAVRAACLFVSLLICFNVARKLVAHPQVKCLSVISNKPRHGHVETVGRHSLPLSI